MEEIEVKLSKNQILLTLACIQNSFGHVMGTYQEIGEKVESETTKEYEDLLSIYRKALDTHKNPQAKEYIGW
jgi:hypothetical protein